MDKITQLLALLADEAAIEQLSNDEVTFLEQETRDLFSAIRAGEVEGVEADDVATLTQVRDAALAFVYLGAVRAEEAAQLDAELAALDADILGSDTDPDTPDAEEAAEETPEAPEEAEEEVPEQPEAETAPEPEKELEPVLASATAPARPSLAAGARHQQARTRPRPTPAIQEARTTLKRMVGAQLAADEAEFFQLYTEAFNDQVSVPAVNQEKVRLGRIKGDFPEELTLGSPNATRSDQEIIEELVAPMTRLSYWTPELQARVATGGFCAPSEIVYTYEGVGSAERPVRDSLAPFNAARGGLQTPAPLTLASIDIAGSDAAVSIYTEAQDIAGATTKPKQRIACGTMRESRLYAVTMRFIFGNFGQRAWPELINETIRLGGVAHAKMAEQQMLDRMKALADEQLETDRVFGAARDIAEAVSRAAAAWRNRNRDYSVQLHVWMPRWVPTMGFVDLMRAEQFDNVRGTIEATFRSWLAADGVNVTFYDDTPTTGVTQDFPAEVSGTLLNPWPTSVQWGLAEEGHYLALTQADLDLGIYRDSTLNNTNDAEMFMETFEAVHKRGVLSQWITSKVCVDGSWSDGIDGSTAMACAS